MRTTFARCRAFVLLTVSAAAQLALAPDATGAATSGSNVSIFNGTPEASAENLIGVDAEFVSPFGGDLRLGPTSVAALSRRPGRRPRTRRR